MAEIQLGKRYPKNMAQGLGSAIWYLKECPAVRIQYVSLPRKIRPEGLPRWQAVYYYQLAQTIEPPSWIQTLVEEGRPVASGNAVVLLPKHQFRSLAELKEALEMSATPIGPGQLSEHLS